MSKFQIILTTVFSACILIGLALFAMSRADTSNQTARIVVWGPLPQEIFMNAFKMSSSAKNKTVEITYVRKDPTRFDTDFIEALADGRGPDVVLLRDDSLYKHRNKLFVIPYKSYTERTFKDTFLEEGELNLNSDGVVGLPFMIDPLVMYWNRDLFTTNLIPQPPKYWDEFYGTPVGKTATSSLIDTMTRRDSGGTITQGALAFGEWRNVLNAKEILLMLMLQAGTPVTSRTSQGVVAQLNNSYNYPITPSIAAVNFYTQFSNPTSPSYTWNRSLPTSLVMFLSGKLSVYFGFASELFGIQDKNPNLNFDVTYVPQDRGTQKQVVFGHMYSLAIVRQSQQIPGAFLAITSLTEPDVLTTLGTLTNLPPVRRDMLAVKPSDAFRSVFFNSALLSKSWIDPDSAGTEKVFRDMIESITSGRARVTEAVSSANDAIDNLLK